MKRWPTYTHTHTHTHAALYWVFTGFFRASKNRLLVVVVVVVVEENNDEKVARTNKHTHSLGATKPHRKCGQWMCVCVCVLVVAIFPVF